MKVAIIALFACVAVSQAAFTANLVQRAQPAISQALFKVRLASGRSDLQTPLVQQLSEHANELLSQIQNAVSTGQEMATSMVNELQNTWAQLQALGSNVMSSGSEILNNLLGGLFGGLFGGKQRSIGAIVDFVQNFSLEDTINGLLAHAQSLVAQLNLPQMLQNVVASLLGQLTGKGFFSDIWSQVSAAWENIQQIVSNVTTVAGDAFSTVQQMAQSFVSEATQNISAITADAATQFLDFLRPYQQDLGSLYDQVVAQIGTIGKN